jgi:hypothetical protein
MYLDGQEIAMKRSGLVERYWQKAQVPSVKITGGWNVTHQAVILANLGLQNHRLLENIRVFADVTPCRLSGRYRHVKGTRCYRRQRQAVILRLSLPSVLQQ